MDDNRNPTRPSPPRRGGPRVRGTTRGRTRGNTIPVAQVNRTNASPNRGNPIPRGCTPRGNGNRGCNGSLDRGVNRGKRGRPPARSRPAPRNSTNRKEHVIVDDIGPPPTRKAPNAPNRLEYSQTDDLNPLGPPPTRKAPSPPKDEPLINQPITSDSFTPDAPLLQDMSPVPSRSTDIPRTRIRSVSSPQKPVNLNPPSRIPLQVPSPSKPWNANAKNASPEPKNKITSPPPVRTPPNIPLPCATTVAPDSIQKLESIKKQRKQSPATKTKKEQKKETQNQKKEADIIAEWMAAPDNPDTQIFGVPLELAVQRGNSESIPFQLPLVVVKTAMRVREHMSDEGIFRLSGSHQRIQYWKKRYDLGDNPNLDEEEDPHVISGLLKLYLRELPETILTKELAPNFEASKSISDPHVRAMYIKSLVEKLPILNYSTLNWVLILLINISQHRETNFMGIDNLALIFSPTFKCSVGIIQTMLTNFTEIFDRIV